MEVDDLIQAVLFAVLALGAICLFHSHVKQDGASKDSIAPRIKHPVNADPRSDTTLRSHGIDGATAIPRPDALIMTR